MKIAIIHVAEVPEKAQRPCEICEREREDIGAMLVTKQVHDEDPAVDFIICDLCAVKIAIAVDRSLLEVMQRAPPPPPPINGWGGS